MSNLDDLRGKTRRRGDADYSGIFDAQVARDLGNGTVKLTIPDLEADRNAAKFEYGPAPWPTGTSGQGPDGHTHQLPAPSPGLWCVVVFAGADVANPRVLVAYNSWEPPA